MRLSLDKMPEVWYNKFIMSSIGQRLKEIGSPKNGRYKCLTRVRDAFYNQDLFDYKALRLPWSRKGRKYYFTWFDFLLNFMITAAVLVVAVYYVPGWVEKVKNQGKVLGEQVLLESGELVDSSEASAELMVLPDVSDDESMAYKVKPRYDLSLPEGRWIVSEKADIAAPIETNDDINNKAEVTAMLDRGIYMYPQYSNIGWKGKKVVLAGHHFNMNVSEERARGTFQNLERLEVGDRVAIINDYKMWTYEVYKVEQSTEITEENPDLLMYSCIYWWDSKLRLFVYAKIVED